MDGGGALVGKEIMKALYMRWRRGSAAEPLVGRGRAIADPRSRIETVFVPTLGMKYGNQ